LAIWVPEQSEITTSKPFAPLVSIMNLRSLRDIDVEPTTRLLDGTALQKLATYKNQTLVIITLNPEKGNTTIKRYNPAVASPNTETALVLIQNSEAMVLIVPAFASSKFIPIRYLPQSLKVAKLSSKSMYVPPEAPPKKSRVAVEETIAEKPTAQEIRERMAALKVRKAELERKQTASLGK
jgi:hypothetical protein